MRDRLSAPIGALLALTLSLGLLSCAKDDKQTQTIQKVAPELVPAPEREWTHLVFINGHNNLDEYGSLNINQLEQIGSTNDVNVVVQWGTMASATTRRLLVQKDNNRGRVTSPILQEMPRVDMGDYRQLVEFFAWTARYFPAKRYFVSLWNHGSGWHRNRSFATRDINFDDLSGNSMTTRQVGEAMAAMASLIGRKVDILGSDACLMAMAEINSEFSESVRYAVASEELEPGLGWPYHKLLGWWAQNPMAHPAEVVTTLTSEFKKHYQAGGDGFGQGDVTLSSADLSKSGTLERAVARLAESIRDLSPEDAGLAKTAAEKSLHFDTMDYVDLGDFIARLREIGPNTISPDVLDQVTEALREYIVSNHTTEKYQRATGISFWLPTTRVTYQRYSNLYRKLKFSAATKWEVAIEAMLR